MKISNTETALDCLSAFQRNSKGCKIRLWTTTDKNKLLELISNLAIRSVPDTFLLYDKAVIELYNIVEQTPV